jgi:hypothetical protein
MTHRVPNLIPNRSTERQAPNRAARVLLPALLAFAVLLAACTQPIVDPNSVFQPAPVVALPVNPSPSPAVEPAVASEPAATPQALLTVPVAVYIVDSDDGSPQLSSARTVSEVEAIFQRVNQIWGQAGIVLDVQAVQRIEAPSTILQDIAQGTFASFFQNANRTFDIPAPSALNAFYVRDIGGPNGINPFGSQAFFVADEPSVHDERVTSHEIGHIFGLYHAGDDPQRLMYSGTNGMDLSEEEVTVARYFARRFSTTSP